MAIGHLNGERNLNPERNLEELIDPILELEALTAIHLFEHIQLLDDAGLHRIGNRNLQNAELQGNLALAHESGQGLHLTVQGPALSLRETLLVLLFFIIEFELGNELVFGISTERWRVTAASGFDLLIHEMLKERMIVFVHRRRRTGQDDLNRGALGDLDLHLLVLLLRRFLPFRVRRVGLI